MSVTRTSDATYTEGIRFYRSRPYLLVARNADKGLAAQLVYLPDKTQEYVVKQRPGIGSSDLSVTLEGGWNLTALGHKLDTKVPPSSWEESRIGVKPGDPPRHEQIWVSYYMTTGDVSDGARLLYDVNQGAVSETETKFQSPGFPIEGTMWAVVRDNRGGTSWRQFPLKVQEDKPAE